METSILIVRLRGYLYIPNLDSLPDELKKAIEEKLRRKIEWGEVKKLDKIVEELEEFKKKEDEDNGEGEIKITSGSIDRETLNKLLAELDDYEEREAVWELIRQAEQRGVVYNEEYIRNLLVRKRELAAEFREKMDPKIEAEERTEVAEALALAVVKKEAKEEVVETWQQWERKKMLKDEPELNLAILTSELWRKADLITKEINILPPEQVGEVKKEIKNNLEGLVFDPTNSRNASEGGAGEELRKKLETAKVGTEVVKAVMARVIKEGENMVIEKGEELAEMRAYKLEREVVEKTADLNPKAEVKIILDYSKLIADLHRKSGSIADQTWIEMNRDEKVDPDTLYETKLIVGMIMGRIEPKELAKADVPELKQANKIPEVRVIARLAKIMNGGDEKITARQVIGMVRMIRVNVAINKVLYQVRMLVSKSARVEGIKNYTLRMEQNLARNTISIVNYSNNLGQSLQTISRAVGSGIDMVKDLSSLGGGGAKQTMKEAAREILMKASVSVGGKVGAWLAKLAGGLTGPAGWAIAAGVTLFSKGMKWLKSMGGVIDSLGIKIPIVEQLGAGLKKIGRTLSGLPMGKVAAAAINTVGEIVEGVGTTTKAAMTVFLVTIVIIGGLILGIFVLFIIPMASSMLPALNGRGEEGIYLVFKPPELSQELLDSLEESCPSGWPVRGEVIQGPNGGYSHSNPSVQAIDIARNDGSIIGATHDGILVSGQDPPQQGYGIFADIHSKCGGVHFVTRYAHMKTNEFTEEKYNRIKKGEFVGIVGSTGRLTGPHLHYQLLGLGEINNYLPEEVPDKCNSVKECNIKIFGQL